MRYDIHFRSDVIDKIQDIVDDIRVWNDDDSSKSNEVDEFTKYITPFEHCATPDHPFLIGGADGSGDFPCVTYGDSFVYLIVAMARLYEASSSGKLKEFSVPGTDIVDFMWLPEDKNKSNSRFNDMFAKLIGEPLDVICQNSDYYELTRKYSSVSSSIDLIDTLIRPEAHDADNIGIQLLSTAEAGSLIRLMKSSAIEHRGDMPFYLLEDTTLALPLVTSKSTLFFEIAKRYACTIARQKNITYIALSKSHNMPRMDVIEDAIYTKLQTREHWFMRIPSATTGDGKQSLLRTRSVPPIGAISYLFRLHKTTQPMRLDMDLKYWQEHILSDDKDEMQRHEIQLFRDLDFASHDQRCFGYPYPIKACHDMVSLTDDERVALRKQIINAAERNGLKRKNFIDPSILTGHK